MPRIGLRIIKMPPALYAMGSTAIAIVEDATPYTGHFEFSVNADDLKRMMVRAANNKSRECHAGPVTVRLKARK